MNPAQQLTLWADKLRDVSAMGRRFAENIYDKHNYEAIREIAMGLMALANGEDVAAFEPLRTTVFASPTPFSVGDAAIIDDNGRILLIQRADNQRWAMPGGALEVGETPAEGAMREALEETGVACELTGFAGVWDSRHCGTTSRHHLYQFVFVGRPLTNTSPQTPSHANEVLDIGWFSENELPENLDPGHVSRIPHAFGVWRGEKRPFYDGFNYETLENNFPTYNTRSQ